MSAQHDHITAAMGDLCTTIEAAICAPDGQRAHFVVLVWTDDGHLFNGKNSQAVYTAAVMTEQIRLWAEEIAPVQGMTQ